MAVTAVAENEMPYIVVSTHEQEVDRRELIGPLIIGRSADCDLSLHDILLSRRHIRIEPVRGGWVATDLDSKNGTTLNGQRIKHQTLQDGDCLRVGQATVTFLAASILADDVPPASRRPIRPTDPNESLSGTVVAGFQFIEHGQSEAELQASATRPRPNPKNPSAYEREEIYSMLNAIASSSWDSIYAEARKPLENKTGGSAQSGDTRRGRPRARPVSPVDLSLQLCPRHDDPSSKKLLGRRLRLSLRWLAGGVWAATCMICIGDWMRGDAPSTAPAASHSLLPKIQSTPRAAAPAASAPAQASPVQALAPQSLAPQSSSSKAQLLSQSSPLAQSTPLAQSSPLMRY